MTRISPHVPMALFSSLVSLVMALGVCSVRALVIDDFTQGALTATLGTNTSQLFGTPVVQTGLDPMHTLGGTRSVFVGSLSLATVSIDTVKGRFHFNANSSNGYFKLGWGMSSPLNVNLASNQAFQIDFVDVFSDMPPHLSLGIFDLRVKSGGTWFKYDLLNDFTQALGGNTFGTLSIPFTKFGGVNFSEVQALELDAARARQGFRLSIDSFTVVPEPSVAALLLIVPVLCLLSNSYRRVRD